MLQKKKKKKKNILFCSVLFILVGQEKRGDKRWT
jgi:hypothetical protein